METLIRRRILQRLIWVCTVCQLPFYGSPDYNSLPLPLSRKIQQMTNWYFSHFSQKIAYDVSCKWSPKILKSFVFLRHLIRNVLTNWHLSGDFTGSITKREFNVEHVRKNIDDILKHFFFSFFFPQKIGFDSSCKLSPGDNLHEPLPLSGLIQQPTNWWYFFSYFSLKTGFWHFMQIVSTGQILFSGKIKKNISKCCLLKILPIVLSVIKVKACVVKYYQSVVCWSCP